MLSSSIQAELDNPYGVSKRQLEGEAIIRFRHILDGQVLQYRVCGQDFRVVDIPTGYTHTIEKVGPGELVTLFWASEIFDPARPDTHPMQV